MQKRHINRKQYFNELARTSEKYFLPFIEKHIHIIPDQNVLEIGCGEGGNLLPFSKRGCKVTGIDVSETRIEEAKQFFREEELQGNFVCQDVFRANVKEKFDIVIIHDVIEHVLAKRGLFAIAKELLNSNGIVYVGFPPWQMPFGGHQQICHNRMISFSPFIHLLPKHFYKLILMLMGESQRTISELMEIKDCRTTIENFKKLVKGIGLTQLDEAYFFINPHYESKFGLKPIKTTPIISAVPILRNYFTTTYFSILMKR